MDSLDRLEQMAIDYSLNNEWEEAIQTNKEIIKIDKVNIPALNRLGKAYLALNEKDKASKIFKNVLKMDPNNKVAKKNILSPTSNVNSTIDSSNLIKEPGTSAYTNIKISGKSIKSKNLSIGQALVVKIHGKISVYDEFENFIGYLSIDIASKIIKNNLKDFEIKATVIGKKKGYISLLIKTDKSIFNSSKSDIIPFIGEGEEELIEDEIDMTTTENQVDVKAREMVGGMIEIEEDDTDEDEEDKDNEEDEDI